MYDKWTKIVFYELCLINFFFWGSVLSIRFSPKCKK